MVDLGVPALEEEEENEVEESLGFGSRAAAEGGGGAGGGGKVDPLVLLDLANAPSIILSAASPEVEGNQGKEKVPSRTTTTSFAYGEFIFLWTILFFIHMQRH